MNNNERGDTSSSAPTITTPTRMHKIQIQSSKQTNKVYCDFSDTLYMHLVMGQVSLNFKSHPWQTSQVATEVCSILTQRLISGGN